MLYYHNLTSKDKSVLFRRAKQCKICSGKSLSDRLVTDHCHTTGIVRGVLCDKCNSWLGVIEGKQDRQTRINYILKLERKTKIPAVNFMFYLDDFRRGYIKSQLSIPKHNIGQLKEQPKPVKHNPKAMFSVEI